MADEQRLTVHSIPLDALRARSKEAMRLVEQARAIVRASFEGPSYDATPPPESGREKQVGATLDAIERLLPGIGMLAVQRAGERGDRARRESGVIVTTPREKTREQIERAEAIATMTDAVASLLCEIERGRTSTVMRVLDAPSSGQLPETAPRRS